MYSTYKLIIKHLNSVKEITKYLSCENKISYANITRDTQFTYVPVFLK
jgi:hypothetical protein